jgi:hypothetical protein
MSSGRPWRACAVGRAALRRALLSAALSVAALHEADATAVPIAAGVEAPRFRLPELARPDDGLVGLDRFFSDTASSPSRQVLLLFAASYCAPCLAELAALPRLAPGWRKLGVEPVVVVIDTEDGAIAAMRARLASTGVVALLDRRTIVARRYGASELPLAVSIGADGRVAWTSIGGGVEALDARVRGR